MIIYISCSELGIDLNSVNSVVLLTNGISFAIQAVLLLFIGAWADYGRWRWNFSAVAISVAD